MFHKKFRGVGFSSIACGYIVVTYYSMLIAWVTNAFFNSFSNSAPWKNPEGVTGEEAKNYFYSNIIGMSTLDEDGRPTRLVGANVGYSALTWFIIFLCVAFGVKTVGRITYITMGIPVILLFIFLIYGLTLEGAGNGVKAYIGEWDMSVLKEDGDVWSTAVSQIFFSLSVTFGVMTAYGSHCPRSEPAFVNSLVVGFANSAYSIIAGFAVFAALGNLAYLESVPVEELEVASFGLVFGSWPVAFANVPGGQHWVRLIFVMLFFLGIDSAFSLLEACLTVLRDTSQRTIGKHKKKTVAAVCCIVAWLFSFIYATDAGLFFLGRNHC
jgi:solute carrier family 6 GABA transporter-like protein 1